VGVFLFSSAGLANRKTGNRKGSKMPESRYPKPALGEESDAAMYWLENYNQKVFKVLSGIDENVKDIRENMATKGDIDALTEFRRETRVNFTAAFERHQELSTKIDALTEIVRDGFKSLGINIANGDHRIGRPVK
jgi:hypothetical protein